MIKRLLVGVCFLTLGAFGLQAQSSSTQSGSQSSSSQQQMGTRSPAVQSGSSQLSRTDQDFVRKAYESNLNEIELGRLAEQKSTDSGVKQFAQKMVDDHTSANNELKRIASSKGIDLPSNISSYVKSRFSNLSGSDFDRQFIQAQVQAHKNAESLFRNWSSNGQDPELKSFAANQLSKIRDHEQMASDLNSRISSSGSTGNVSSRSGSRLGRSDYGNTNTSSSTDNSMNQSMPSSSSSSTSSSTSTSSTSTNRSYDQSQNFDQSQNSDTQNGSNLPRTASNMPLIGLVGLMLLTAALIVRSFRSLGKNR